MAVAAAAVGRRRLNPVEGRSVDVTTEDAPEVGAMMLDTARDRVGAVLGAMMLDTARDRVGAVLGANAGRVSLCPAGAGTRGTLSEMIYVP
jgi:hypothetical protein